MQIKTFFYQLHLAGPDLELRQFLGTAFPIAPNGGLIACHHVVGVNKKDDELVVVIDAEMNRVIPVDEIKYSSRPDFDIAFIPDAFQRPRSNFSQSYRRNSS